MAGRLRVIYVTSSRFKIEENEVFSECCRLADGSLVKDVFDFEIRQVPILETLEVEIPVMVQAEVAKAYAQIRVPCVVEHAGLIFADYRKDSYPGGLTKPMWNTLGDRFIEETRSAGREAVAQAVVAYCNGKEINTFVGETEGIIADSPRGGRQFYWDTVFVPRKDDGLPGDLTYAEMVEAYGIEAKMKGLSQSAKAMLKFLEFYRVKGVPEFWRE